MSRRGKKGTVMNARRQGGFSMVEMLVSLTILVVAMTGLASLLIHNSKVNKAQQMTAEVQSNARNCLSMLVQKLRSAGWDPKNMGINTVTTDTDLGDNVSEITVFMDLDKDGFTTTNDEEVLIRHINNQVQWRRTPTSAFIVLANNISNDADGDGTIEPMFVPDATPDPTRITVQITARSPVPDPISGEFIRYTVSSDVVLRKEI